MGLFNFMRGAMTPKPSKNPGPNPSNSSKVKRRRAWYGFAQQFNLFGGRLRAPARLEIGEECDLNGGGLSSRNRLVGIALARTQLRNNPQFRGFIRVLQTNIVGTDCKLRFFAADGPDAEKYRAAERYFNEKWGKRANFRDNGTFHTALKNALSALVVDGDFVCLFDRDKITGSGKLVFWEADQICNLDSADFLAMFPEDWKQNSGVVIDSLGRERGVIVTHKRGATSVPKSDAIVLTKDPDSEEDSDWVLVKSTFRLIQTRGSAPCLPALPYLADCQESLQAELTSAKLQASRFATLIEGEENTPAGEEPTGFLPDGSGDGGAEDSEESEVYDASRLDEYVGGNVAVLPPGSDLRIDESKRPNTNLSTFLENVSEQSGAALGLSSSFARGKSIGSFSAAKFDMMYAQSNFEDFQQDLEDAFLDWVARMVLCRAMERGFIPALPEGWESEIAWTFPRMQSLNGLADVQSAALKLRSGLTSFALELGPAWKEHLKELGEEMRFLRENNLPLNIFETAAGAMAETPADTPADTPTDTEETENKEDLNQ